MRHWVTFAVALGVAGMSWAADAPQFRGPARDGIFADTGLLKTWPAEGPQLAWKTEGLGKGYSSVAVVGDTIYHQGMLDDNQGYLFALDLSGKVKWKVAYGPETLDKQAPGSRATPTIDGDRIYVMSGLGGLTCFQLSDQKQVWQVDTAKEFKGENVFWAISESPLVDGDLVFATPGGPDASVVALDKMTGKTVWTSKGLSDASGYCSPVIFEFGGRRELVTMTNKAIVGLDEKAGELLWRHEHKANYGIHANTPVRAGNVIYYVGDGAGGGAIEVSADGKSVTQKWLDNNLNVLHHGVVLLDGYIYGAADKSKKLTCLELATGKVMWTTEEVTTGETVYADGMLYIYEESKEGAVHLVKASPEKFEHAGSFPETKGTNRHWAHPCIANGRLYLRYDDALYAYDIKAK